MTHKSLLTSFLLAACVQGSFAGSMGPIEPSDFDGFYAGLGTGFATLFERDHYGFSFAGFPALTQTNTIHDTNTAVLFEGHVGYGQWIKPQTYLGLKGAVNYSPIQNLQRSTDVATQSTLLNIANNLNQIYMQPVYNIDAVLGYEVYPHLLPFVEGGVSFANVISLDTRQQTMTQLTSGASSSYASVLNSNGYKTGYNVGIGSSYQLHQHWLLSSELLYTYLGKHNATASVTTPVLDVTQSTFTQRKFQWVSLLGSVSYRFPV